VVIDVPVDVVSVVDAIWVPPSRAAPPAIHVSVDVVSVADATKGLRVSCVIVCVVLAASNIVTSPPRSTFAVPSSAIFWYLVRAPATFAVTAAFALWGCRAADALSCVDSCADFVLKKRFDRSAVLDMKVLSAACSVSVVVAEVAVSAPPIVVVVTMTSSGVVAMLAFFVLKTLAFDVGTMLSSVLIVGIAAADGKPRLASARLSGFVLVLVLQRQELVEELVLAMFAGVEVIVVIVIFNVPLV
jgi:hypothetical protein